MTTHPAETVPPLSAEQANELLECEPLLTLDLHDSLHALVDGRHRVIDVSQPEWAKDVIGVQSSGLEADLLLLAILVKDFENGRNALDRIAAVIHAQPPVEVGELLKETKRLLWSLQDKKGSDWGDAKVHLRVLSDALRRAIGEKV